MKLCENCIHDLGVETQADEEMPFPKLTVLGSLIGAAAGLLFGSIFLIPVGMVTGAVGDVIRCDRCNSDQGVYRFLEKKEDDFGKRIFRNVPFRLYEDVEPFDELDLDEASEDYFYDELEGKFTIEQDYPGHTDILQVDTSSFDFGDFEASFDMGDFGDGADSGAGGQGGGQS